MEYKCVLLNSTAKLAHDETIPVLFESDNMVEACVFIYEHFQNHGLAVAVWQPRHSIYRSYYRKPFRDDKGRFSEG